MEARFHVIGFKKMWVSIIIQVFSIFVDDPVSLCSVTETR